METFLATFENAMKLHWAHQKIEVADAQLLIDAMEYSTGTGGKRFRPQLCAAVGVGVGLTTTQILPWSLAIEMIHTYSLIHDDLPALDNDDYRRGHKTCHKQYNEAMAILAGDALLTEAFGVVASSYGDKTQHLIQVLVQAAGARGMIRGQVIDLKMGAPIDSLSDLIRMHELKTGELIAACFTGPAVMAGRLVSDFKELGLTLGLAFQVKDDLLDAEKNEEASFINFLGFEATQSYLQSLTEKIHLKMQELGLVSPVLQHLIDFNFHRTT